MDKSIAISGGFDPLHIGHVRMIQEAAQHGDVWVFLNSDEWLLAKKGYVFMPWEERKEMLRAIRGVTTVFRVNDADGTVCDALRRYRPSAFANGGDRRGDNTPEVELCESTGINLMWGVGGGKIQSSSELAKNVRVWHDKPWGRYCVLDEGPGWKVKRIDVDPSQRTSLQVHKDRMEYWVNLYDGGFQSITKGQVHRLGEYKGRLAQYIEVQLGDCREEDIIRLEDDYGRSGGTV